MSRIKPSVLAAVSIVFLTGVVLILSVGLPAQARPGVSYRLDADSWIFLPVIMGSGKGPSATPTSSVPSPTVEPTKLPTATATPEPGKLASPTLYDILNNDQDGNFTVGWSSVVEAEYYRLQQKRNSDEWQQIYEGSVREITRSDLNGGQYCYRVMALNAAKSSEWSATKCTTVATPTATPDPNKLEKPAIKAINNADNDGNFLVSWTAVDRATNYLLKQKVDNGNWQQIYDGPEAAVIRSRMADGQYCYQVLAYNPSSNSDWSSVQCTTVDRAIMTPEAGDLDPPVVSDIENGDQDGNYTLEWSAVPEAEWYNVHRNYNDIGWGTLHEGFETSLEFSNMADGEYCYRVRSFNSATHSEFSNVKCTTVFSGLTAPILSEIDNADGDGNYLVAWSAVTGADEYIVREQFNDSEEWTQAYRGTATTLNRANMQEGKYCYQVRAIIIGGEWGPFSEVNCTIVGSPPDTPTPTSTPDPLEPPTITDFYRKDTDSDYISVQFTVESLDECYAFEMNYRRSGCLEPRSTGNPKEYYVTNWYFGCSYGQMCVVGRAEVGPWGSAYCGYLPPRAEIILGIWSADGSYWWKYDYPYYLDIYLDDDCYVGVPIQYSMSLDGSAWELVMECTEDYDKCATGTIEFDPREIGEQCYRVRRHFSSYGWAEWSDPYCVDVIDQTQIRNITFPTNNQILVEWDEVVGASVYYLRVLYDGVLKFSDLYYDDTSFSLQYSDELEGEWCFEVQAYNDFMRTPPDRKCVLAP